MVFDEGREKKFPPCFMPDSLEELLDYLKRGEGGDSPTFLAGATDWMLQRKKNAPVENTLLVDLSGIDELRAIRSCAEEIRIGAMATMTMVADNEPIRRHVACLARAAESVGSWQIRNRATLGGNLANASPAADTPCALAALDTAVLLLSAHGSRWLQVCDLLAGPNATILVPGELIAAFNIPLRPDRISAFGKVGSRSQMSIARLNLAVSAVFRDGSLEDARVFIGTLGTAALRCPQAEKVLSCTRVGDFPLPNHTDRANIGAGANGVNTPFCEALVATVEGAIPGRGSLSYKRSALRALGLDVGAALRAAVEAEALK